MTVGIVRRLTSFSLCAAIGQDERENGPMQTIRAATSATGIRIVTTGRILFGWFQVNLLVAIRKFVRKSAPFMWNHKNVDCPSIEKDRVS